MLFLSGMAGVLVGLLAAMAVINLAGKPDNAPLSLDPAEALSTYFFSFSWAGGTLGTVAGAVLLATYLFAWCRAGQAVLRAFTGRGGV